MIRESWFSGRKTRSFTLQWHLTNACAYQCRHCYDRLERQELDLAQALGILEDFRQFCRKHRVTPQVSLSGGDPLRYTHFWPLYRAIAALGMRVSILGNPVSSDVIERLMAIHPPDYYQVSLEGLAEHNDAIRGAGHFARVTRFLEAARPRHLRTHVMLTLTRANLAQVIDLAQSLRGLTARFTFNRLARVGNGVDLELPDKAAYVAFLRQYREARRENPVLRFKDNLLGILGTDDTRRRQPAHANYRGCTGYGCGAAFNFVALLPDGEVHACRKFPSPLGNILTASLETIYHAAPARQYRAGPQACRKCRLEQHCRGCMAVVHGLGLNPLRDRDPFCFIDTAPLARPIPPS
jgi:selenobiotic family peptide radical SAM maturase